MLIEAHQKVNTAHLRRDAYLYIRQSTAAQVAVNRESTERQYRLRERALQLGWPQERIKIIDEDLANSGSGLVLRQGIRRNRSRLRNCGRQRILLGSVFGDRRYRIFFRCIFNYGNQRFGLCNHLHHRIGDELHTSRCLHAAAPTRNNAGRKLSRAR